MKQEDIDYLFEYVRDLQKQVNQLKIAVLTGSKNGLELPKPIQLNAGEKMPLGHLADDLLDKKPIAMETMLVTRAISDIVVVTLKR